MSNKILVSSKYEDFSFIKGNRKTNDIHVKSLMENMKKYGFDTAHPIQVRKRDNKITAGQHRFKAAMELKIPFYYVEVDSNLTDEEEVQKILDFNRLVRNWQMYNYLDALTGFQKEDYLKFQSFIEKGLKQGKLSISDGLRIVNAFSLDGSFRGYKGKTVGPGYSITSTQDFKKGKFLFNGNYSNAMNKVKEIENIRDFSPCFNGFKKSRSFIRALVYMVTQTNYDHKRMMKKLVEHESCIRKGHSAEDYIHMLQAAYTYKDKKIRNLGM